MPIFSMAASAVPDEEVWALHPSGALEVSTHGRARNPVTGRVYRPEVDNIQDRPSGRCRFGEYDRARLSSHGGKWRRFGLPTHPTVASLILETFVGPRPPGHDADHVNHDSLDNRLCNLRWRLHEENMVDRVAA